VIAAASRSDAEYLVLGAVRGVVRDVEPVVQQVESFAPRAVGLGLSFEEMTGLNDHFVHRASEPLVPLTRTETAELLGLSRIGEVRVPHPAYVRVLEWARENDVPVEALDPSDEGYANLFTEHIGYLELVRRTLNERRLTRAPPEAANPDEYALTWQRGVAAGRGSRAFLAAREAAICEGARRLARRSGRTAVVVDRERFEGVAAGLRSPAPANV
jgi:hypothetical protein